MTDAPKTVIENALDDLDRYINYEYTRKVWLHPSEMRQYKRVMKSVDDARAALDTLRETVECKSCQGSGKDVRYLEDTRDDTHETCLGTGRRVKP